MGRSGMLDYQNEYLNKGFLILNDNWNKYFNKKENNPNSKNIDSFNMKIIIYHFIYSPNCSNWLSNCLLIHLSYVNKIFGSILFIIVFTVI